MKFFGRKSAGRALARPALSRGFGTFIAGEWPRSYEGQVRDGYIGNPVAQRAVRLVAEGVASAPLTASDDNARALIAATSGGQALIETLAIHLLLHGNGYVQLLCDPAGRVTEMFALRPERVSVEADARGWPMAFLYRVGEKTLRIPADQMIHIRTHNPLDDHYGLGCLGAASGPIAIHNAATKWNKALLDNAARPSGALVYDPGDASTPLSGEQYDRLKTELLASYAGADNAGRPMLLEGGLSWQAMSLSPADMDFIALKGAAARDIELAFGVPPMLLGLPGDATYANYREANKALWRQTILPLALKLLGAIAEGLRPWFAKLELGVDLDAVTALSEDRERLWAQVSGVDFLTLNEKREAVGLAALELPAPTAEVPSETALANESQTPEVKYNHNHDLENGQFTFGSPGDVSRTNGTIHMAEKLKIAVSVNPISGARTFRDGHVEVLLDPAKPLESVDRERIGKRTVKEASNILTNETNGLSGGAQGELARAKAALAHTIRNGLLLKKPPQVAEFSLSAEVASSIGRADDQEITRLVHVSKMAGGLDTMKGAIYYGTSKDLITSRPVGGGRQNVLERFGPFDHGRGPKQYIYIYGEPYFPVKK
jgi:HK97 family phage portal protein